MSRPAHVEYLKPLFTYRCTPQQTYTLPRLIGGIIQSITNAWSATFRNSHFKKFNSKSVKPMYGWFLSYFVWNKRIRTYPEWQATICRNIKPFKNKYILYILFFSFFTRVKWEKECLSIWWLSTRIHIDIYIYV